MAHLEVCYYEDQASIDYKCYHEKNTNSSEAKHNKNQQQCVTKKNEKRGSDVKGFLME